MLFFGFGAEARLEVALAEEVALVDTAGDGEICRGLATGVGVMVAAGPDCSGARVLSIVVGDSTGRFTLTPESDAPPHPAMNAAAPRAASTATHLLNFAMPHPRRDHEPLGAFHVRAQQVQVPILDLELISPVLGQTLIRLAMLASAANVPHGLQANERTQ